jgi:hypothetical protein
MPLTMHKKNTLPFSWQGVAVVHYISKRINVLRKINHRKHSPTCPHSPIQACCALLAIEKSSVSYEENTILVNFKISSYA